MSLNLREETYQQALRDGIRFSVPIALRDRNELVKVVVYDPGGDRVGSAVTRVDVKR